LVTKLLDFSFDDNLDAKILLAVAEPGLIIVSDIVDPQSDGAQMNKDLPILTVTVPHAENITDLSKTTIKEKIRDGTFETVLVGRRRLILYASIERYIQSLRGKSAADGRRNPVEVEAGLRAYRRRIFEQRRAGEGAE
jgi:hypothetical protein